MPSNSNDGSHRSANRSVRDIQADASSHGSHKYFSIQQYLDGQGKLDPPERQEQMLEELGTRLSGHLDIESGGPKAETAGAGPSHTTEKPTRICRAREYLKGYLGKFKGAGDSPLPVPTTVDLFISWLGAFLGIFALAGLNQALVPSIDLPTLIPSFGASAVLIFGVIDSKLAQPRNFVGGQIISAIVGCVVREALGQADAPLWIIAPIGMSLALLAMQLTKTTHPPGGATALIAATVTHLDDAHGFKYVLSIMLGCVPMLLIALIVNNLHVNRKYPTFWW